MGGLERTACVWVPQLELQARFLAEPELCQGPVLLADIGSIGGRVIDASQSARACGVRPQMLTTRARALCPEGIVIPPDPALLRKQRAAILGILYRFGPVVGRDEHEAFFIDLADLQRLHPDEKELAESIARALAQELALRVEVAIADSPISAWVVTRAAAVLMIT
jgi:DNA polymerase-4